MLLLLFHCCVGGGPPSPVGSRGRCRPPGTLPPSELNRHGAEEPGGPFHELGLFISGAGGFAK